ncbi:MAG: hypothetical protein P8M07_00075 [Flavobacteriales bacterium]|nr:hypothetical protein [Flavobacteriales bacterium]
MKFQFSRIALMSVVLSCAAASAALAQVDPFEIRFDAGQVVGLESAQQSLIASAPWQNYIDAHPQWQVQFDARSGGVHRAYGPGIVVPGDDPIERTEAFLAAQFNRFGWNDVALTAPRVLGNTEKPRVIFQQHVAGSPVKGSEVQVLFSGDKVVMWGAQVWAGIEPVDGAWLSSDQLVASANNGLPADFISSAEATVGTLNWWPEAGELRPMRSLTLSGKLQGHPVQYRCAVDLLDGRLLDRVDQICNSAPTSPAAPFLAVEGTLLGAASLYNPYIAPETIGLPHVELTSGSNTFHTSAEGEFSAPGSAPLTISGSVSGRFSRVFTDDQTPEFSIEGVLDGDAPDITALASATEISAYVAVTRMHDHMKGYLPAFEALDFPVPTHVDITGDNCNAYYTPGEPSVNFYAQGGDCNAFSLVSDVAYHEYGHGINDQYYLSLGSYFSNGAMNEGYADFWALSLSNNPVLGQGCYNTDPTFYIRRYDEDPKVYPEDLVGQVHADGEIICGAWYDTHILMGGDWSLTMALFLEVYDGLQATTANGNEGEAFTEVLLDLLNADDDNGDLTDGTPHSLEILEGFGIHGITLFSNVHIDHNQVGLHPAQTPVEITATASIVFPYSVYFEQINLYYRTSPTEDWAQTAMTPSGSETFTHDFPAQPEGTVIRYFMSIEDIFGAVSSTVPFSSNKPTNANLPFHALIGLTEVMRNDLDETDEFGVWQEGVIGDLATTGEWETTIPVGSFSDPGDISSVVAPYYDHTPFGDGYCFVTGESPTDDGGIGVNDIDGGQTTLLSPTIDVSQMLDPVMSYWRWYVNAPASGANPGADWWQVEVSDDNGASWVYVENTKTQDVSWRQSAFRVQEYVDLTTDFRMRFTASDSLHPGQEYEGGSLIEAAVDDIILYDLGSIGVDEPTQDDGPTGLVAWPVPARDVVSMAGWRPSSHVEFYNASGLLIATIQADTSGGLAVPCHNWPTGTVIAKGENRAGRSASHIIVVAQNN